MGKRTLGLPLLARHSLSVNESGGGSYRGLCPAIRSLDEDGAGGGNRTRVSSLPVLRSSCQLVRDTGIEPVLSAWKADVLAAIRIPLQLRRMEKAGIIATILHPLINRGIIANSRASNAVFILTMRYFILKLARCL